MKIGVSSYSFSSYIKSSGCDYFKLCDIAHEIGFDGIEFVELESKSWGITDDPMKTAGEIREYCAKLGLEVSAYTVGANLLSENIDEEVERVLRKIDVAAELGAPLLRHDVCYSLPKKPRYSWREAMADMVPHIRRITEYAEAKGIRTCTENHGYIFQDPARVEELIRAVDRDNYGWLCDMGNFLCADCDPARSVTVAAPYTFHAHAKDFLLKSGDEPKPEGFFSTAAKNHLRGTVVGHGVVPVARCVSILKSAGYDGYLSLEFEGMEDTLAAIRAGYAYLRKITE